MNFFPRRLKYLTLFFFVISCGGGGGGTTTVGGTSLSVDGTQVLLQFDFSITLADANGVQSQLRFPGNYSVPFYINDAGQVLLPAKDFPRLVLRVCDNSSARTDCQLRVAMPNKIAADLAIDLCEPSKEDKNCGSDGNDTTIYKGVIQKDGSLAVGNLGVRLRGFLLEAGSIDGLQAADTASGLAALDRFRISVSTGVASSGTLLDNGVATHESDITLVSGGTLPSGIPVMGGNHFIAKLSGRFNIDPLTLIK